jgi:ABC-type phosphate transport system substrate-binding protein
MNGKTTSQRLGLAAALFLTVMLARTALPAAKNIAVIVSAGTKMQDVQLAELAKLCKGTQKAWPDGRSFLLVMKDPESPDMHTPVQKLFGMAPSDLKSSIGKLNEARQVVKIVDTDDDLLHAVEATPGAVGIVDVYSINSAVKVLRVDGKLPFDVGYALKGN